MATYCFRCDCGESTKEYIPMSQVSDPASHPHCKRCGTAMYRDYPAEGVKMWRGSQEKGHFPYVAENLGSEPVRVESKKHLETMMKEQGIKHLEPSDNAKYRARVAGRRFY